MTVAGILLAKLLQYVIPLSIVWWFFHRRIKGKEFGVRVWQMGIAFWITALTVTNPETAFTFVISLSADDHALMIRAKVATEVLIPAILVYAFVTWPKPPPSA